MEEGVCHCGHSQDDHHNKHGECLDDDCECIGYEEDMSEDE